MIDVPSLRPLLLSDRPRLEYYLRDCQSPLSAYSFPAHYSWKSSLDYLWTEIAGAFCLFAHYDGLFFMPIPPLGNRTPGLVRALFRFMAKRNRNPAASRIEQVDVSDVPFFEALGLMALPGYREYLYRREDLVRLAGDPFKSKRSDYNAFVKGHPHSRIVPYQSDDREEALELLEQWSINRRAKYRDPFYSALMDDSRKAHAVVLRHEKRMGLTGRVLRDGSSLRGYTFGFPSGSQVFCCLFEITQPSVKGLSVYLFREFCRELTGFQWINTLDDSGLENLRKTKESYRPWKYLIPYTIRLRQDPSV